MKQKVILFIACICIIQCEIKAQSRDAIKTSTDILMFVTPASGFITTLALKDFEGTKQLILGGATSIATSYLLKYIVEKQRPDGSDYHSFPSNHTAMSAQGASFIAQRYGWKYSIPAYIVTGYIAWGRVYTKRHDTWDVLAGAAIGIGSTYIFTRPFSKKHNLVISPVMINNENLGIYASMVF
jgi:membrane-associated phospholipid phosphatase